MLDATESAMLDAVSYLMDGMDRGYVGCLTTADTSKAFDSVQHRRLLEKLGWYGIETHWFEDWPSGRRQSVRGGSGVHSCFECYLFWQFRAPRAG